MPLSHGLQSLTDTPSTTQTRQDAIYVIYAEAEIIHGCCMGAVDNHYRPLRCVADIHLVFAAGEVFQRLSEVLVKWQYIIGATITAVVAAEFAVCVFASGERVKTSPVSSPQYLERRFLYKPEPPFPSKTIT